MTAMNRKPTLVLGLAGLLLLTGACTSGTSGTTGGSGGSAGSLSKVLLLGDSIAAGEALPLGAAFEASGVAFQSIAEDGGGNVVGPASDEEWKTLPGQITSARPTVLVYQISTYDWGTREQQQSAYANLLAAAGGVGAKLVFVTMPPIRPDDFYRPHLADMARTADVARAVAAGSGGQATVLDSSAVWGSSYQQQRDGKPDRSADGIHTCPQGAARFTDWLLGALAKQFTGFTPASPQAWANTGWAADSRFHGC